MYLEDCALGSEWAGWLLPGQKAGTTQRSMTFLGATRDELLFVAVLTGLTLLGTYVGDLGEAVARFFQRRPPR